MMTNETPTLRLNTSNLSKLKEFQSLGLPELKVTNIDLQEPDATPIEVIASKATQIGSDILVEDTSLDIEGEDIGVNIKWLQDSLHLYLGKEAVFRVLLGIQRDGRVLIYKGEVKGQIVEPSGDGFGFDPFFKPYGSDQTLAEFKPTWFNSRALAVQAFIRGDVFETSPLLHWNGQWQNE